MEAVINKLGGELGVRDFLNGKFEISFPGHYWKKAEDGIIYLSVTSDGTIGPVWKERLRFSGFDIAADGVMEVLDSPNFNPTSGVTYGVAIIPGKGIEKRERNYKKITSMAKRRGLTTPGPEIACLLREKLSKEDLKDMDIGSVVIMHNLNLAKNHVGYPVLLEISQYSRRPQLETTSRISQFYASSGFVFVASVS